MFCTKGVIEIGEIVNDAFQKPELSKAFSNKNSVSILHLQTGRIAWSLISGQETRGRYEINYDTKIT